MSEEVAAYLSKYCGGVQRLFRELRELIYQSVNGDIEERLWARLPSYCCGVSFVRLIPFSEHINIEAAAITEHRELFAGYDITPKGMLKLKLTDTVPRDALRDVFKQTLTQ